MMMKHQTLLRSTSLVSIMTFLSRMMGFIRDMVLAQLFGASPAMDAFLVAFRIPNFMRRLFAEGAFSQAFVPVLAEYQQTRTLEEVRTFIAHVAGRLSIVLLGITLLGILAAPVIMLVFAPGFGEGSFRFILATDMLRITFPYLFLISMTAMAGAVLNTYGYFGVPAITPIFLNITMIACAIYLSPYCHQPVIALAWGVLIAGIIQFLFQLPFLFKRNLLVKPRHALHHAGVNQVMKLMIPALFGVSIAQLNLMVDSIFASFLQTGSVSWLYFTDRLTDFPLGVFGVAIATVILPHLSRRHADQNTRHFSQSLDWGLKCLLVLGLPATVGLTVFSMPLIASCFAYGHFSLVDIIQTQKSLIALSLGIPAFMMVKILASGFYACQDISTPVKVGAISMIMNSVLCAAFIWPLAHAGLALASAVAGYINCGILLVLLIKRNIYKPQKGWLFFLAQLGIANGVMGIYLYFFIGTYMTWLSRPAATRLLYLLIHVGAASIVYIISLAITGLRISQFRGAIGTSST